MSEDKKIEWKKKNKSAIGKVIKPLLGNLLLLIEEDIKNTLQKKENAEKLLNKLKQR